MGGPRTSVATADDLPEVAALRTRVFVVEQGVPAEIEQDAAGATAVHVLSRDDWGRVVVTGRLLARGRSAGIGRMATDAASRGRVMRPRCSPSCTARPSCVGVTEVELHAQMTARGFYERAGYLAFGEEYQEAGIAPVTMRRRLPDGARGIDRSADAETRPVRPSE